MREDFNVFGNEFNYYVVLCELKVFKIFNFVRNI